MKYSKGQIIHKTKKSANTVVRSCRQENIPCTIRRLKKGYRVDKHWS